MTLKEAKPMVDAPEKTIWAASQHKPNRPENRSPTIDEIQAADRATGGKVPVIELIKALIAANEARANS